MSGTHNACNDYTRHVLNMIDMHQQCCGIPSTNRDCLKGDASGASECHLAQVNDHKDMVNVHTTMYLLYSLMGTKRPERNDSGTEEVKLQQSISKRTVNSCLGCKEG